MTDDPKAYDHFGTHLKEGEIEFNEAILEDPECNRISEAVLQLLGARKAKPHQLVHVVATLSSLLYNFTEYTFGELLDLSVVNAGNDERRAALERSMKKAGFEVQDVCLGCEKKARNIPSA